jgi:hypothetical protein
MMGIVLYLVCRRRLYHMKFMFVCCCCWVFFGILYQPMTIDDDEHGAVNGMSGRGN